MKGPHTRDLNRGLNIAYHKGLVEILIEVQIKVSIEALSKVLIDVKIKVSVRGLNRGH